MNVREIRVIPPTYDAAILGSDLIRLEKSRKAREKFTSGCIESLRQISPSFVVRGLQYINVAMERRHAVPCGVRQRTRFAALNSASF